MKKNHPLQYVPCNICESAKYIKVAKFISNDLRLVNETLVKNGKPPIPFPNNQCSIVQCQKCSLQWINPRAGQIELSLFYEGFYSRQFSGQNVSFETSVYNQINLVQETGRIKEINRYIKKGKLLDIGAGPGHFLHTAKNQGWDVYGQDISVKAASIAKNKFGVSVYAGAIQNLPYPDNFFDVATMHSTLEHCMDPSAYISLAAKKLKPGGLLVFNVPNIRSVNYMLAKLFRLPYPGYMFEHLYYFNPNALIKLLHAEFSILEMTSFHHSRPLYPETRIKSFLDSKKSIFAVFLHQFIYSKEKWLYLRNRLYYFQMRIFREYLEYNRALGKLQLGDVIYVFAQKKSISTT